jgi:site-specific recombinase XerD
MKRRNLANSNASYTINRLQGQRAETPKVTSTRFSVGFYLRNGLLTPEKECSIYMDLSYGRRRRLGFATGYFCLPADFDSSTGIVKGNDDMTRLLAMIKSKAIECYTDMKLTKRAIDLQIIKAYSLDIEIEGVPTATQCLERFWLEEIEGKRKVGDVENSTCRRLKAWNRHVSDFILERHGKRVALSAITPADAQACLLWLRDKKQHSNNVAMRIVSHFKRVLNFAVANEWIQRNPFLMFRRKMENKRQESLTVGELEAIKALKFASDVLEQVRDIFVFSCHTGLAYNELSSLTPAHIKVADDKLCIFQARDKTHKRTINEAYIPLGYDTLAILEKYRQHPVCLKKGVCLPVQANQRVNAYLKQIQHVAGIKKRLTTHTARRTFATHRINEGFAPVIVSAMMAHGDISTTMKYYAKVSPEAVVREFERVKTKNG